MDYNPIFMRRAIEQARKNLISADGGPFGACIVKDNLVLAVARNTVLKNDATCHAEINAIRTASLKLKTFNLSGCEIYSTTEPCPMCFSAIHWAKIDKIFFGTTVQDAKKLGFNELTISNEDMKKYGDSPVKITGGILLNECRTLFDDWNKSGKNIIY